MLAECPAWFQRNLKEYDWFPALKQVRQILAECGPLINESDLHISQLTMSLLTTLCQVHPPSMSFIHNDILPQLLSLVSDNALILLRIFCRLCFLTSAVLTMSKLCFSIHFIMGLISKFVDNHVFILHSVKNDLTGRQACQNGGEELKT